MKTKNLKKGKLLVLFVKKNVDKDTVKGIKGSTYISTGSSTATT